MAVKLDSLVAMLGTFWKTYKLLSKFVHHVGKLKLFLMLIVFSYLSPFRPTIFVSVPRVLNRVYDRVSMFSSYSSFI